MEGQQKSWYDTTAYNGMKKEQDRLDGLYGPRRLWMPEGQSKEVVFVDDNPPGIYEHNPKLNGNWQNWITCLQGVHEPVTCCEKLTAKTRYYVGFYTVVNCSKWKDKKGNEHQYELELLAAKLKTLKKLKLKQENRGALIGSMYVASRTDANAPSCGDDFDFKREVDMVKLFPLVVYNGKKLSEFYDKAEASPEVMARLKRTFQVNVGSDGKVERKIVPFNYMALLEPKSPRDLKDMLGNAEIDSGGGASENSKETGEGARTNEEDAPF